MKPSYVARYERDENGHWSAVVNVDATRKAVSDGKTLDEARKRIREALALLLEVPEDSFDFVEETLRMEWE